MRRIILVISLAAFGLVLLPSPADGAIKANPSLALPVSAMAVDQDGWPDTDSTPGWGDWAWDLLLDHLTIPLGPADQNIWPLWTGREFWLIAERLDEFPVSA